MLHPRRRTGGGGYGSDLSTVAAVLRDGTVLWPGPRQRLFALDSRGRLRWTIALDGEPTSPLVDLPRRRLYLADMSGALRAFDLTRADSPPVPPGSCPRRLRETGDRRPALLASPFQELVAPQTHRILRESASGKHAG